MASFQQLFEKFRVEGFRVEGLGSFASDSAQIEDLRSKAYTHCLLRPAAPITYGLNPEPYLVNLGGACVQSSGDVNLELQTGKP